jgi:acetylglutamate kinase
MHLPLGFRFAGVHAGLKPVRRDLALVACDGVAVAAGCFSQNLAAAAPIIDARGRVPSARVRGVVVHSGNANALTGTRGVADVAALRAAVAGELGCEADELLCAATGVIGAPLPLGKLVAAAPELVRALGPAIEPAAEAILTTDTRTKLASRTVMLGGANVTIAALAKGSGMISPALASLIAVIVTDCAIAPGLLDAALRAAIEPSFHALVIDGDMSTNDTVYALASGRAGNAPIEAKDAEFAAFREALTALCIELAKDIAADGEGATRVIEVAVAGAPDVASARDLARAVCGSPLVKAAMFGADPNWGRVLATVGARAATRGYAIDPQRARVVIQGVTVFDRGPVLAEGAALRAKLRAPEVRVEIALAAGDGAGVAWGCDLGYDYVKLNADYTSLIVQRADGQLAKDDRLTNYSPSFKRSLIVEALAYISRFAGTRSLIALIGGSGGGPGGVVMKPALVQAFCAEVALLRSVGLVPVVVHGGGRDEADHAVTLLGAAGARAIGISGKDGGLVRASSAGELAKVDAGVLEMMLAQGYVPIVSPLALGEDGRTHALPVAMVAAELAVAIGARKLIYVADAPGVVEAGELVGDVALTELKSRLAAGTAESPIAIEPIARALGGGVERVHVIDGRTPHAVIAELFTDRGVGTLITA